MSQVFLPTPTGAAIAPDNKPKGGMLDSVLNKGYLQKGLDLFGQLKGGGASEPAPGPSPDHSMSTTTKVLLGVGGAAVLALIIYGVYKATR